MVKTVQGFNMSDQFLFVETYRPKTVDECILPESTKAIFNAMVLSGKVPSMIFHGSAGSGKTSAAKAIADQLGFDNIVINGSIENGIDVLRTKLTQFASSVSMNGKTKMIIVDEADGLTPQVQNGLKSFIEEYSSNVVFIFTCNHPKKIINPIHSRCAVIDFKIPNAEKPKLAAQFAKRMAEILDIEGVSYDKAVLAKFLIKYFPDFRRTLNELQRYSNNAEKTIDVGILGITDQENIKELLSLLKDKDFKRGRQWVAQNSDMDSATFYRTLFDSLLTKVKQVPQMVLIIADYQYKAAFCADQEINNIACLIELMSNLTFNE